MSIWDSRRCQASVAQRGAQLLIVGFLVDGAVLALDVEQHNAPIRSLKAADVSAVATAFSAPRSAYHRRMSGKNRLIIRRYSNLHGVVSVHQPKANVTAEIQNRRHLGIRYGVNGRIGFRTMSSRY